METQSLQAGGGGHGQLRPHLSAWHEMLNRPPGSSQDLGLGAPLGPEQVTPPCPSPPLPHPEPTTTPPDSPEGPRALQGGPGGLQVVAGGAQLRTLEEPSEDK